MGLGVLAKRTRQIVGFVLPLEAGVAGALLEAFVAGNPR